jgi:predicted dehydrogenase
MARATTGAVREDFAKAGGKMVQYRAILVGCGHMAATWMTVLGQSPLASRVQIVGLVDPDLAAAGNIKADHGLTDAALYADLLEAIDDLRPDLVFDVAIPAARNHIVRESLKRGCHVLTEKPMAVSLDDARAINAAAASAGRIHAVTQNRRFKPGIRRVCATVQSGVLGELTALHCDFFLGAHFGGFRDEMEHVLLLDMAIHTFDAARCISGEEPLAVYCVETNPKGSWYRQGAAANAIFEFTGGVAVTYRGSWCAEGADTHWDASWRIIGTKGTLLWDGEDGFNLRLVDGDTGFNRPLRDAVVPPPADPSKTLSHASVIADFLDAVDGGASPETVGTDNIKSLAMVFGAIESAAKQRRIIIEA